MKIGVSVSLLTVFLAGATFCSVPKLTFTKSFPGSTPEFESIDVDRTGVMQYKEALHDDQPVKTQLTDADTAALFSMAEKLDFFKSPLESGLKVANTGKKTLRYEDETGAANEQTFNYSTNVTAQQLLERFEQIAETERAWIELQRAVKFDKLGVNDALATIESLWLRKQLAAPQQFLPLLTRIAARDSFMHLARERAARLKDQFDAPVQSSPAPESKQR